MQLEVLTLPLNDSNPRCAIRLCLQDQSQTLLTHQDITLLRRCADALQMVPNRIVNVVVEDDEPRARYIIKTLLHLGVSIGQVTLNSARYELQA